MILELNDGSIVDDYGCMLDMNVYEDTLRVK